MKVKRVTDKNLIPLNKRTTEERKKIAAMGGVASGETRRRKALLKKLGYTGQDSFDFLLKIQERADAAGNLTVMLKAEELKGKLAGLYVEKVATTNSEGEDIQIPVVSSQELLAIMERRRDDRKRT